jgi:hypothetical protein
VFRVHCKSTKQRSLYFNIMKPHWCTIPLLDHKIIIKNDILSRINSVIKHISSFTKTNHSAVNSNKFLLFMILFMCSLHKKYKVNAYKVGHAHPSIQTLH